MDSRKIGSSSEARPDINVITMNVIRDMLEDGTLENEHIHELILKNKVSTFDELTQLKNFTFNVDRAGVLQEAAARVPKVQPKKAKRGDREKPQKPVEEVKQQAPV